MKVPVFGFIRVENNIHRQPAMGSVYVGRKICSYACKANVLSVIRLLYKSLVPSE